MAAAASSSLRTSMPLSRSVSSADHRRRGSGPRRGSKGLASSRACAESHLRTSPSLLLRLHARGMAMQASNTRGPSTPAWLPLRQPDESTSIMTLLSPWHKRRFVVRGSLHPTPAWSPLRRPDGSRPTMARTVPLAPAAGRRVGQHRMRLFTLRPQSYSPLPPLKVARHSYISLGL